MPWRVSFDPDKFEDALTWFRARVPMAPNAFYALEAHARDKAFTVSHVAQMDVVQQVLTAIDKAIEKGQDLRDFGDEVGKALRAAWSGSVANPAHRLEVIFRTNTASAFSRGRQLQMDAPAVVAIRPWRLFDDTRDQRESEICRHASGRDRGIRTVVRHDDPWLETHTPPLHHQCRSVLRALTDEQARREPGFRKPPDGAAAAPGFGIKPTLANIATGRFKPDYQNYDPELATKAKRKEEQRPDPPKVEPQKPRIPEALKRDERSPAFDALDEVCGRDAAAAQAGDFAAQRRMREATRAYLEQLLGISSYDASHERGGMLSVDPIYPDLGGHHDWDGGIEIGAGVFERFTRDWKATGGADARRRAHLTIIHEELHGCSPALSSAYTTARSDDPNVHKILLGGGLIEECTTEALARRALKAGHGNATEYYGSYQKGINWLEDLIKRHLGGTSAEVHERFLLASARMRTGGPRTATERQHVERFLDGFDNLSSEQRELMRNEILSAEIPV